MATLAAFAKYVRPNVPGCPDLIIEDAIRSAAIEFCSRTKCIRERVDVDTVIGQIAYDLGALLTNPVPPLPADVVVGEILFVERPSSRNLDPSSFDEFAKDEMQNKTGTPNRYYVDESGDLILGPEPVAIETLTAVVKTIPGEAAAALNDNLYRNYVRDIARGAKAILMLMNKQPWTDVAQAGIEEGLFDEAICKANLNTARGSARKRLRVTSHPF